MVSVAITQFCWSSMKKLIDNMEISKCGCFATTVYFRKQEMGKIWPKGHNLLTTAGWNCSIPALWQAILHMKARASDLK